MLMREYYDKKHGEGAWDRMHDLIYKMQIHGWVQPDFDIDGKYVSVFPGTDREITVEAVEAELRRVFLQIDSERAIKH